MYKVLLINPWVYDFAAVNMWSRPLGLLKVAEYMSGFEVELHFIDCMDAVKKTKPFGMAKYPKTILPTPEPLKDIKRRYGRYGIGIDEFQRRLEEIGEVDLIFITSIMTYWYPGVVEAVRLCKKHHPSTPVVVGGIYASLCYDHATKHTGADFVYRGRVNDSILSIIEGFGIKLKRRKGLTPYYRLPFYKRTVYSPILTSEGCPFRCAYCASAVLWDGFSQREPDDVIREIEYLHRRGVKDIAFYDDALLVGSDTHLKPILREIIGRGFNLRFHTPNGIHARFIDEETAHLMKRAGFVTLRLSLETVNPLRQASTGGKVYNDEFAQSVNILKGAGFRKEHIGVYLMYGLPGQELKEVKEGVEFLMGLQVRVHLAEFSPIPGTGCWEELVKKGVLTEDLDPLLTNNTVFSLLFCDYSLSELRMLKSQVSEYNRL
ncbi:MAG: radical SAM protein [Nitrospirae bacterium]|nr:MAG: radical SAM protein [Nitrospirota bacterium]